MPWKESKTVVPEGNGPIPQNEELEFGQLSMGDAFRLLIEKIDRRIERMDDEMRERDQHYLTRLEHGARQPRLAVEADGQASTRTRERVEGAATAAQAMRGDCSSARQVEPGPDNSTSFGMKAEPPALIPCKDVSVVERGAAASKSCLPSMEMRPSTAAGDLVPTGDVSKVSETTLDEPPLRFCLTEEPDLKADNSWTSNLSASYDSSSSSVIQETNLSATPYCGKVVDTKSGQNRTFDPGGSRGHLRACPFGGSWRALVCGEVWRTGAVLQRFFDDSLALWNKAGFDAGPGKSLAVEDGSSLQEFVGGTKVTASWRL